MKILAESEMDNLQHISMRWLVNMLQRHHQNAQSTCWFSLITAAKRAIPPWGLEKSIIVKFLADDETKMLPEATTCFYILSIPVFHTSEMSFFKYIDMAIRFESNGFDAAGY